MPDKENKIEAALKEINYANGLQVNVADGRIVSIPKQRLSRPKRNGVRTEIEIEEAITD